MEIKVQRMVGKDVDGILGLVEQFKQEALDKTVISFDPDTIRKRIEIWGGIMKTLLVLNRNPYDGTDVTWNALRLAEQLLNRG